LARQYHIIVQAYVCSGVHIWLCREKERGGAVVLCMYEWVGAL
jgi:hypothetical protein